MASRATFRDELRRRLGDTSATVWSDAELNGFLNHSIKALYPTYFQRKTGDTLAGNGPAQMLPAGAKDLYYVGLQRLEATRIRPIRGWIEGDGVVIVPKLNITGFTLHWGWTEGWDAPATDNETIPIPKEAEEVTLLRANVLAMEKLLASRTHFENFQALLGLQEGVTDNEINASISSLKDSLIRFQERAIPLPEKGL